MKKIIALVILMAVSFISNTSYSQPKLVFHLTGGYSLPLGGFRGIWPGGPIINPDGYYMKSGFHFGADGKYYIDKDRSIGITLSLAYNMFKSDDLGGYADEFGNPYSKKDKINIFSSALGVEYGFLPKGKINPFVGTEITGNFFSGNYTPSNGGTVITLKNSLRFGFNICAGVDFHLTKSVGAVIGLKYDNPNIIGKKDNTETTGANETGLQDKSFTDSFGAIHSTRNIQYVQFYAGLSVFLMQKKVKTRK